jgi:hypothetical protein
MLYYSVLMQNPNIRNAREAEKPWELTSRSIGKLALMMRARDTEPKPYPEGWQRAIRALDLASRSVTKPGIFAEELDVTLAVATPAFVKNCIETVRTHYNANTHAQAFYCAVDDDQIPIRRNPTKKGSPFGLKALARHFAEGKTIDEISAIHSMCTHDYLAKIKDMSLALNCTPHPIALLREACERGIHPLPKVAGFELSLPYRRDVGLTPQAHHFLTTRLVGVNIQEPDISEALKTKYQAKNTLEAATKACVNGDINIIPAPTTRPRIGEQWLPVLERILLGTPNSEEPEDGLRRIKEQLGIRGRNKSREAIVGAAFATGICVIGYVPKAPAHSNS